MERVLFVLLVLIQSLALAAGTGGGVPGAPGIPRNIPRYFGFLCECKVDFQTKLYENYTAQYVPINDTLSGEYWIIGTTQKYWVPHNLEGITCKGYRGIYPTGLVTTIDAEDLDLTYSNPIYRYLLDNGFVEEGKFENCQDQSKRLPAYPPNPTY